MAEYIDRNLVLIAMNVVVEHANAIAGDSEILQKVCSILEDCKKLVAVVSAADVAPVVHGRWIPEYEIKEMYYSPDDIERYKVPNGFSCSVCTKWSSARTNYCPNCGARMDGGVSDG